MVKFNANRRRLLSYLDKMADSRNVVVCDCVCFIVNKYGKLSVKTLRSVLLDFYTADELSDAKFLLCSDIDKLDLTLKRPHVAQRRDTDIQARITKEVDDIMLLFAFADENNLFDQLPRYVSSSPDRMPSLRLYDGDMNVLLNLLHTMEKKLSGLESGLAAITRDVHSFCQAGGHADWPHLSTQPPTVPSASAVCDVNKSSMARLGVTTAGLPAAKSKPTNGNSSQSTRPNSMRNMSETVTDAASAVHTASVATSAMSADWATLSSTPCHTQNRFSVLDGDDGNDSNDGGDTDVTDQPYIAAARRGNKRRRHGATPQQHEQQQQQQSDQQPNASRVSTAIIGKAINTNVVAIKAATKIRKR